jgi:spore coat protein U-like protein
MRRLIFVAMIFCMLTTFAASAAATTSVCTWVSPGTCSFGTGYAGVAVNTTGTLTFNCTTIGSSVTLEMEGGDSGTDDARYMESGSNHTTYQAYIDSGHTTFFGRGTGNQLIVSSPVLGNNTATYYCQIPAGLTPASGTYTDTVVTDMVINGSTISGSPNSTASFTMADTCDLSVTTNVAFGAYDPIGANHSTALDATGSIQVACTSGLAYNLLLDQGTYAASGSTTSVPLRQMASGSYRLPYFFYQNSGNSTVWGDTTGTGVSATGTGSYVSYTVYGEIPAGKTAAAAGSYSDTVTVTASY